MRFTADTHTAHFADTERLSQSTFRNFKPRVSQSPFVQLDKGGNGGQWRHLRGGLVEGETVQVSGGHCGHCQDLVVMSDTRRRFVATWRQLGTNNGPT